MPQTTVLVYRQANGTIPLVEWLDDLSTKEPKAHAKCLERILRLSELGYELRRPLADSLSDGICELRTRVGKVHYRILYFYFGRNVAVLSHGCTKEDAVPPEDIERAIHRKGQVESNPTKFTAEFDFED